MLQILQKQHDQMAQLLCYNVFLIKDWSLLIKLTDNFYQYDMAREDDYDQLQSLLSSLTKTTKLLSPEPLSFQHLEKFRQTSNIQQKQGSKQKFELGMGYAKKALDLAIWANKIKEFIDQIEKFIDEIKDKLFNKQHDTDHLFIGDSLYVSHKG
ncbi:16333_t:CDS:2 [Cetraspora pellucida]|uniref:16333_t:CDS:1 n=1 Tax=Cetraspora pellucida TaxID=1433469 RepID=A0A9N9J2F8_9GLOM|nr:16333_t:CDS:2 [Cetraspora pellucida]